MKRKTGNRGNEKHGERIKFSSQREHLKLVEQLINIFSPSTTQYSFLPAGYNGIEIIPPSRQVWRMVLAQKRKQIANVKKSSELVN